MWGLALPPSTPPFSVLTKRVVPCDQTTVLTHFSTTHKRTGDARPRTAADGGVRGSQTSRARSTSGPRGPPYGAQRSRNHSRLLFTPVYACLGRDHCNSTEQREPSQLCMWDGLEFGKGSDWEGDGLELLLVYREELLLFGPQSQDCWDTCSSMLQDAGGPPLIFLSDQNFTEKCVSSQNALGQ